MFEDETIAITCPKCGHCNAVLIRAVEVEAEAHIICNACKVGLKLDLTDFQHRLDQVRQELDELERNAAATSTRAAARTAKDDYQI